MCVCVCVRGRHHKHWDFPRKMFTKFVFNHIAIFEAVAFFIAFVIIQKIFLIVFVIKNDEYIYQQKWAIYIKK